MVGVTWYVVVVTSVVVVLPHGSVMHVVVPASVPLFVVNCGAAVDDCVRAAKMRTNKPNNLSIVEWVFQHPKIVK